MRSVIISEDQQIFGVPMQKQAQIFSMADFELQDTLSVRSKVNNALAISADNKWVALSGGDGKIRIFSR
jgi:hypothetical protein